METNGAAGPAEAPIDIAIPAGPRVHFPVRVSPILHQLFGVIFDLALVGVAVGVFVAIAYMFVGPAAPADKTWSAVSLMTCVAWLMYRYVFFGTVVMTPGGHAAASVCDRVVAWQYNRAVDSRQ